MPQEQKLIPPHGDYRRLRSFQCAQVVCDATVTFCTARSEESDLWDPYGISTITAEVAANTLICLINQGSFLLGRQLQKLEQQFLTEGGFTERLYRERRAARERDKEKR